MGLLKILYNKPNANLSECLRGFQGCYAILFKNTCFFVFPGIHKTLSFVQVCYGAHSSAGEHYGDIVGVAGSIPAAPTIY